MKCRIVENAGAYEVYTPYEGGFLREMKALVPASARCYNGERKTWTISEKYGRAVADLCCRYFGTRPSLPPITTSAEITGILTVLYIGRVKDRGNGDRSAFGWMQLPGQLFGGWNVIFPEAALRGFFDPSFDGSPSASPSGTYYEILGIKRDATEAEVKAGYRRMVKQWHPDVCKDPDAHETFIRIQHAFEALSDRKKRARYDVGLRLQDMTPMPKRSDGAEEYRSPLKCGHILCKYSRIGARCAVSSILSWQDITDANGRILVTSWEKDASEPTMIWN